MSPRVGRAAAAFALVAVSACAGIPIHVAATHQGPSDVNGHDLNILVYHPTPDAQGDPWGVPAVTVNGTRLDWMAGFYGAYYFPTVVFDGVDVIESTPTGESGGGYQQTYASYRAAFDRRIVTQSPLTLHVEGLLEDGQLRVWDNVTAPGLDAGDGLVHRFVLYEDDVHYSGGNGVVVHRFVVRALGDRAPLVLRDGGASFTASFPVPSFMDERNMGVVAFVQNQNSSGSLFAPREVVQSATWTMRQTGPTHQVVHGVLMETYSATWCVACVYGDSATDALATQFGVQSSVSHAAAWTYLRAVEPWKLGTALAAGVLIVLAARPRRGPP